jgi:hypothetical protein
MSAGTALVPVSIVAEQSGIVSEQRAKKEFVCTRLHSRGCLARLSLEHPAPINSGECLLDAELQNSSIEARRRCMCTLRQ